MLQAHATSTDPQTRALPETSQLYHLSPRGIGTASVECMTSYLSRLADEHVLGPRTLHRKAVFPKGTALGMSLNPNLVDSPVRLNGTGEDVVAFTEVLEALTLRPGLRYLSMIPWSPVLSGKGLLRPTQAWCPQCFQEWARDDLKPYSMLLWGLQVVRFCPKHERPLRLNCPSCGATVPLLRP